MNAQLAADREKLEQMKTDFEDIDDGIKQSKKLLGQFWRRFTSFSLLTSFSLHLSCFWPLSPFVFQVRLPFSPSFGSFLVFYNRPPLFLNPTLTLLAFLFHGKSLWFDSYYVGCKGTTVFAPSWSSSSSASSSSWSGPSSTPTSVPFTPLHLQFLYYFNFLFLNFSFSWPHVWLFLFSWALSTARFRLLLHFFRLNPLS